MNQSDKRKSFLERIFDISWFIKKRLGFFFLIGTIVLTISIGLYTYIKTSSFQYLWVAFIVSPGIMLLAVIGIKIQQYEDKHNLTHFKEYNGAYLHTSFPMKKYNDREKNK